MNAHLREKGVRMGVQERLSLDGVSAEHADRLRAPPPLPVGGRVCARAARGRPRLRQRIRLGDPARDRRGPCSGWTTTPPTIDMARATVGATHDVRFEAADAVEFLERDGAGAATGTRSSASRASSTCREPGRAAEALARARGRRDEAGRLGAEQPHASRRRTSSTSPTSATRRRCELFGELGDTTVLYQFLAEGSLDPRRASEGRSRPSEVLEPSTASPTTRTTSSAA